MAELILLCLLAFSASVSFWIAAALKGARQRVAEAENVISVLACMIGDETCTRLRAYEKSYDVRLIPARSAQPPLGRHHRAD